MASALSSLAALAEAGRFTDVEEWLDDAVRRHPAAREFCATIREALERLDFDRIACLARQDVDAA